VIVPDFLGDVARFVDERIAAVVLNGTYEITQFEVKLVDGATVVLNYLVPASEVSEIALIELRSADGSVVSSNAVQIPIAADTVMVHTIETREVS
jgi:hypothetical protein